jgi:hypothetical protein
MAGDLLFRKPSIAVIQGDSEPMYGVVHASATVTYMIGGKLVSFYSTNDGEIDIAGTNDVSGNLGILGYEYTPDEYRPATRDTAVAVGDHVAVHTKPGMRFRGFLTPGTAAVYPGAPLYHGEADSSGNFQLYLGGTSDTATYKAIVRARARETIDPSAKDTAIACWMEWV